MSPVASGVIAVRTKILAYLGALKPGDFASARRIVYDLDLRFTTAKNTLDMLEARGLVEKVISNKKGIVAMFRIDPAAVEKVEVSPGVAQMKPYIPPDWEDAYGKHPGSG